MNGNREQTNNFLLDGVDNNDSIDNRIGYQPNVDALQEVQVITGNGSSEFGNVGGAIVNARSRAGQTSSTATSSNFCAMTSWMPTDSLRIAQATKKRALRRNIFGGTFGGPVMKNKAFFFVDYEGTEQRDSGPANASVAPAAWRTGDLTDFQTQSGLAVKDPLTRLPFPGNIIPGKPGSRTRSRKSCSAVPNSIRCRTIPAPVRSGITNNYVVQLGQHAHESPGRRQGRLRLSDKDNLMMRWSISKYESFGSAGRASGISDQSALSPTTQSAVLNWTRTFSPTIVNEARVGYTRVGIDEGVPVDWSGLLGTDGNAKFGIAGGQPVAGLSVVTLGSGFSGIGPAALIGSTVDNKISFSDNLTWQRGAHLLKIGGQAVRYRQNRYYAGNNGALGLFTYDGTYRASRTAISC